MGEDLGQKRLQTGCLLRLDSSYRGAESWMVGAIWRLRDWAIGRLGDDGRSVAEEKDRGADLRCNWLHKGFGLTQRCGPRAIGSGQGGVVR